MLTELRNAIIKTSRDIGVNPVDLATAMSYETGGTFNPWQKGPTTQWGQHRGLIQWGVPQRQRYGVTKNSSIADQVSAAGAYLRDAGVEPGMGLLDIYSAINAGKVGRYNASDAGNGGAPGSVRDKVEKQMGRHRQKALSLIGDDEDAPALGAVNRLASAEAPELVPNRVAQSVNYVPPPGSGQQGQFAPLPAFQTQPLTVPRVEAPAEQETPPAPSHEPQDDILKAWGISEEPAANPAQAETPDIFKAWGIDENSPAPAADIEQAKEAAPSTFGGKVGETIDTVADAAAPAVSMGNNLVRQTATGVPIIGGLLNKANAATNALIAPAINPMLSDENKLLGSTFGERYDRSLAMQNGMDADFQAAHPVLSTGAQLAGGIGALGGVAASIPGAATAFGMKGNLLTRTVAGGLSGAALGGGDAAIRSEGDLDATIRGAELGGALGAVAPKAGQIIGAGVNKLTGAHIPQRIAKLAELARDKYGISVGPGQLSTNPTIKFLDSVVNRLPLSGGTAAKEAQQQAFNKAVASSFGETADVVTPEVMTAARGRIGKVFDSVAARTPAIKADAKFGKDLVSIMDEADQALVPAETEPLRKQALAIVQKFKEGGAGPNGQNMGNQIDGATYQALTRKGTPLDRAMQSSDPNVRFYAGRIRDALDDVLERSASPEVLDDLRKARSQWKAMKTVEDLAEKSTTGDISPALLMGAARKSYGNMAYGKGQDLVDLARIGQQFLKEAPSSGTAERTMLGNLLLSGAGGGGAAALVANPGAIPFALGGALATGAVNRGVGAALRSPYLANKMIQNSLGTGTGGGNLLLRSVPQGSLPQTQRRPLEITVTKPSSIGR